MSGAAGSPGQTDYAYANRFLDAFTAWRRGSGRPGRSLSVLWSLWADGGIRVDADEATAARMARQVGLVAMPTDAGLEAFDRALGHDGDHVLVAHGNLARLREVVNAPAALGPVGPRRARPACPSVRPVGPVGPVRSGPPVRGAGRRRPPTRPKSSCAGCSPRSSSSRPRRWKPTRRSSGSASTRC